MLAMMETLAVGNTAEAAVLHALVERGFQVLVPFGDGQPYDLVVHVSGTRFLRVQCKSARDRNGCVVFNSWATDHGQGARSYRGLADLFGVFLPTNRAVYIVPVDEVPVSVVYLRHSPSKNNQRIGIRLAAEYEIDAWAERARGLSLQIAA